MRKVKDKERADRAVELAKAKEEGPKVAGARCWNRILLRCLKKTGNISIFLVMEYHIVSWQS